MKVNTQLKYPIKYAVMPIEQQIGWSMVLLNELEQECHVALNIVSKCYVVGERKEYKKDGTCRMKYEVVFLFLKEDLVHYGGFRPAIPEYNIDFQCTNSIFVEQLFNSFEEASIVAEQANNEILAYEMSYVPIDSFEKVNQNYQELLSRYQKIEEIIEKETHNFKVTKTYGFDLENLIEKVLKNSSEFYRKLDEVLSVEERDYLRKLIKNKSCNNCANGCCRIENYEKVGVDEFGRPQGGNCASWDNPRLIGKQLILTKTKD